MPARTSSASPAASSRTRSPTQSTSPDLARHRNGRENDRRARVASTTTSCRPSSRTTPNTSALTTRSPPPAEAEKPDDEAARDLVRQALAASNQRRATFFIGEHAFFREVEPFFLNMEGVASWVAYKPGRPRRRPHRAAGKFWSQQEGLLLFLLIDRFDPTWKGRVFDAEVPSPFAMLRAAL